MKIDKDIAKIKQWLFSSENKTKIAIKILRGSAVTKNALFTTFVQISSSVRVVK